MIAQDLVLRAKSAGLQIATAESCTAGLIAGAITEVPGSSSVFDRGFVTYSNAAKIEMLGVSAQTLATFGAVSEPVAVEMANGALAHSPADLAIAVTGIAGPGGSDAKPEGRVCFALAQRGAETRTETHDFGAIGRQAVRSKTVEHALRMVLDAVAD